MRNCALPVLLLVVSACGAGPDDLFVIGGRTVSTSGGGVDGVDVLVYRLTGAVIDPVTAEPQYDVLHRVQSADGGLFSFDLVRVEVQSLSGGDSFYTRIEARFDGGTRAFSDMVAFPNQLVLSDFNDWSPDFSVGDAGLVSFTPVASQSTSSCRGNFPPQETLVHALVAWSDAGLFWEQADHTVHLELSDAGDPSNAVRQVYDPLPLQLPLDVLEDRDVTLMLEAKRFGCVEVSNAGTLGGGEPYEVLTRWKTTQALHVKGTRKPVSRGAKCPEVHFTPCPLTDGNPAPVPFESPTNSFHLTLDSAVRVKTIVLRGAVVQAELPVVNELSIKVGTDALSYFIGPDQVSLDDVIFFEDGNTGVVQYTRIELPRPVGDGVSKDVQLELNRVFLQLGELSLFVE